MCSFLPNSRVIQLYMYVLLLISFSILIYHGVLNTVPCPIHWGTFSVHPVYNSLLLRIPGSQSILPPAPHLGSQSLSSVSVSLFHRKGPPCRVLASTLCDVTWCLSVSLHSVRSSLGPPTSPRPARFRLFHGCLVLHRVRVVCLLHPLFSEWASGFFCVLDVLNSTAVNVGVHGFVLDYSFV